MTKDLSDWSRVDAMTGADPGERVADDPDTFVPDPTWWKTARIDVPHAKEMVTLRLDPNVLAWFRQAVRGGSNAD